MIKDLFTVLPKRMAEIRNENLVTLILYLQNGKISEKIENFLYSIKVELRAYAQNIMKTHGTHLLLK